MASISAESQGSPNILESPSPKVKMDVRRILVVLVVICIVGLPLAYFTGRFNGNSTGYNTGYSEGYDKGWDAGRFDFYYVKPQQKYGVYDLSDWIERWEWIKPYEEGVFDCSEMSAYLEWKLENEGWHTVIVVGDSPFGSGHHAWLLVETSDGKYTPVESTNMDVVWWDSPYFDNYFTYEHEFETIQAALDHNETEFDWWKG